MTAGTERRIRRTTRNALTDPCGRRAAAGYTARDRRRTFFSSLPAGASGRRRGASDEAPDVEPPRCWTDLATRRNSTRRRAELTGAGRDAGRRGAQNEAQRAVVARCARYNKWPLTRRTTSNTTGTERRIRRTTRGALTKPCGRLCCGRLCGTRHGGLSSLSYSPAPRCSAEARASGGAPWTDETPRKADARRAGHRAPRRAERGTPGGTTSQDAAGPHNKWPLTRRTDGTASGTARRIRRATRSATTKPCGRLCCGRLCGTRPGGLSSLSHNRRLGAAPRRKRAAERRDTTRRRARLTRDDRDADRRGWKNEARRLARRRRLAPGRITNGRSPAAQRARRPGRSAGYAGQPAVR